MPFVAPWTQVDPMAAIRAGASLNLERRGQDISADESAARLALQQQAEQTSESEAAARLKLSHDQLAQEAQLAQAANAARQQQAAATLALRGQQLDALEQYRQSQEAARQQQLKEAATKEDRLAADALRRDQATADYRKARLAQGEGKDKLVETGSETITDPVDPTVRKTVKHFVKASDLLNPPAAETSTAPMPWARSDLRGGDGTNRTAGTNAFPPAPANPADRKVGQAYTNSKGDKVAVWTGQGWQPYTQEASDAGSSD